MKLHRIRVRFAPSPTGFMHLGNVRAALINYLFAHQRQGIFILRIEDTDQQRLLDPQGTQIIEDLQWLGLAYQEGPLKGGSYGPYYQSQRGGLYQEYLEKLIEKNLVYRCFCTQEELETKRQRQIALKMPPRYDRTCAVLSEKQAQEKLSAHVPFIWRFKLDETKNAVFFDLARKTVSFELKHFSDFPLTRQDGSHTFLFANFVDDLVMQISHVFRGEDHLTNTANQVALYEAFDAKIPQFWHLPIIGNQDGKKLSKRDFGFSLTDLRDAGFLPEAICNYLAIIGGGTFEKEIMTKQELVTAFNFDHVSSTGQVRYDLEKLRWVNHQWIRNYSAPALAALCLDLIKNAYPSACDLTLEKLTHLIGHVQQEIVTLADSVTALEFYFTQPIVTKELLETYHLSKYQEFLSVIIQQVNTFLSDPDSAVTFITKSCKEQTISIKDIFTLLRLALTGKAQGPGIKDILFILGAAESVKRLEKLII